MAKINVLIVDADERYVGPLERKFTAELNGKANIGIITDINYLEVLFSTPQTLDILLINEQLYNVSIEKHNIGSVFILTEEVNEQERVNGHKLIYKYTSVREIYNMVYNNLPTELISSIISREKTKVITVYSPIGGSGKTTIAMMLAANFATKSKRVLFVGTDNLQTFAFELNDAIRLKQGIEKELMNDKVAIYDLVEPSIIRDVMDVFPPLSRAKVALNIGSDFYSEIVKSIKARNIYDYIVVDTATDFSDETIKLFGVSDQTLILVQQDRRSAYKVERFLYNVDCSDSRKYTMVCNQYKNEEENTLVSGEFDIKCRVSEYINYNPRIHMLGFRENCQNKDFNKISDLFI